MTEFERIEQILIDLAEPLDLEVLDRTEDGSWMIKFEREDPIEANYSEDRQVLCFSKDLAAPAESARATVHTMALQYNFLWEDTGGGRLSLSAPEEPMTYSVDVALPLCTLPNLKKIILNVREVAASWTAIIISNSSDDGGGEDQSDSWMRI